MNYFLDVPSGELDEANDIIKNRTNAIPLDSYPHPSDGRYHRMEFEEESNRNRVKNALGRFGIESFSLDGSLTSTGLFMEDV